VARARAGERRKPHQLDEEGVAVEPRQARQEVVGSAFERHP